MTAISEKKFEEAIRTIIKYTGDDPDREGLRETPQRIKRFYKEWFKDEHKFIPTLFSETYNNMVILKDIPFYSFCEHHMLPFNGKISVGYLPNKKVLGLSKVVRIVHKMTHKLQIQERIGKEIADELEKVAKPRGVMVVIEAEHLCMSMRGVRTPGHSTITSEIRGLFKKIETRTEFLTLIKN